jgi:hypothetical protein
MPSATAITLYTFGVSAIYQGASILLAPRRALAAKQLPELALPSLGAFSVAITGIGCSYILAAYQENRAMFFFSLLRLPAAAIFAAQGPGWRPMAAWEAFATCLTAAALAWEARA